MAYRFEFDSTNRILGCRFAGVVSDEELTRFYRETAKIVMSLDPLAGVVDFLGVTSFDVSVQIIRQLARFDPAMPKSSHPRIVVASASHIFGMARMFQFEGEATRPNLHVVRTLEEAWAILAIRKPKFESIEIVVDAAGAEVRS